MLNWIRAAYSNPTARVRANGVISEPFSITNGTRQGCPLSPLLFALSLEPFLCHIRSNPDIMGIEINNTQYKVSAYADDMLFSITKPNISLPNLMNGFAIYGRLSNLKINFTKSEAMGVGIPTSQLDNLKANFSLKWTNTALKYIGTYIPPKIAQTFKLNFPPLLKEVQRLLTNWDSGLHSWFGRCSILKMTILPKFLYLLQAVPIHIPASFFKQVNTAFIKFLWAGKKPRISKRILSFPKLQGGIAMPDIKTYYHAVHLSRLIDWCRHRESKLWTQIEQAQSSFPLNRTPWCHADLPFDTRRHPLIGCTISLCAHLFSRNSLSHVNSSLRPILGNPRFMPGMTDLKFHTLKELGFHQASHFSTAGHWRTLTELSDSTGQYKLDFFRALQLHHFLNTMNPPNTTDMPLTTLEEICTETGTILHTLSLMYKLLITPTEDCQNPYIDKWEEDLNCQFTETQKQHILTFTHKSSICAKIQETNYKILTRWYRTPSVLKKCFPTTSDICWRCTQNKGTLLHIFWSCPRIKVFWGGGASNNTKIHRPQSPRQSSILPPTCNRYPGKSV